MPQFSSSWLCSGRKCAVELILEQCTENALRLAGSGYHYMCEEYFLEEDACSLEENYGIRNQDVNPNASLFTVCSSLPLYFLDGKIYRGNA